MLDAYTPLAGGNVNKGTFRQFWMNLAGGLNFTRQSNVNWRDPYPTAIGAVQGLLGTFDQTVYAGMFGPNINGPWTGPANAMPNVTAVFPNIQGGFAKVTG